MSGRKPCQASPENDGVFTGVTVYHDKYGKVKILPEAPFIIIAFPT
jgi:hypothetical protein